MSEYITNFKVNGMTCDACVKLIHKRLSKTIEANTITIDKSSGIVSITGPKIIAAAAVKAALAATPYSLVD